jgi:hypothetical protein
MTLTTKTYMPERKYIPFTESIAISSTTAAASPGTAICTSLPIHNVDWVEMIFHCATHAVDITYTLDSTGIVPASGTVASLTSTTDNDIILAVKGVPSTSDLSFGSHALTLKAVDATASGVITGYIILHGHRLL